MRPLTRGGLPQPLAAPTTVAHIVARDTETVTVALQCMGVTERNVRVDVSSHVTELVLLAPLAEVPNVGDVVCDESGARVGYFVSATGDRRRLLVARDTDGTGDLPGQRLFCGNVEGIGGRPRFFDPNLPSGAAVQHLGDVIEEHPPVLPEAHSTHLRLTPGTRSTVLHGIPLGRGVVVSLHTPAGEEGIVSFTGYAD